MRKFLFFLFIPFFLLLGENEIPLYNGDYTRYSDLKKILPGLDLEFEPISGIGKITNKPGREVSFLLNSSFLGTEFGVIPCTGKIRFKRKEIFIPYDIVTKILYFLFDENFSIRRDRDFVYLNLYQKEYIKKSNIEIDSIVIDPGHGGNHLGAIGLNNELEKQFNLELATLLERELKRRFSDLQVLKIRNRDELISLEERAKIATEHLKKNKNSIFISLHCNSVSDQSINPTGFEVYFLDQRSETQKIREAMVLDSGFLNRERPFLVKKIQSELFASMVQRRSVTLAGYLEGTLKSELFPRLLSRGVKKSNFLVLRKNLMPSVLVEIGFLTNKEDLKVIANRDMQLRIVKGIIEGIRIYANKKDD